MSCLICELKNKKLKQSIERYLDIYSGVLPTQIRSELKVEFEEEAGIIEKLDDDECALHWNFHQTSSYLPDRSVSDVEDKSKSLKDDIGKDEASVLYDLMNKQMETFNRLTKRINNEIDNSENDLSHAIVNPITIDLYDKLSNNIRMTIKELKDLNTAINGEKSSSLDGLKAIAVALTTPIDGQGNPSAAIAGVQVGAKDLSTDEYDY